MPCRALERAISPAQNDKIGQFQKSRLGNTPDQIASGVKLYKILIRFFWKLKKQKATGNQIEMIDQVAENAYQQMDRLGYEQRQYDDINARIEDARKRVTSIYNGFTDQAKAIAGKRRNRPICASYGKLTSLWIFRNFQLGPNFARIWWTDWRCWRAQSAPANARWHGQADLQMVDPGLASHQTLDEEIAALRKEYLAWVYQWRSVPKPFAAPQLTKAQ